MIFARLPVTSIDTGVIQEIIKVARDSEIIGISSMAFGADRAKKLILGLRSFQKIIVWGGIYPTIFTTDCLRYADIVCLGEGEAFMVELADRVSSGKEYFDIKNGAFVFNSSIIINDVRSPVSMDNLMLPDFDFENEYILDEKGKLIPNTEMKALKKIYFGGARGCTNSCSYCSNSALNSLYHEKCYVRKMSIPRFIELAKEYRALFNQVKRFVFTDEDFFGRSVEELREFALIYPHEVGIPFECTVSPLRVTAEKVALSSKAGMYQISVGLESGSERVRKFVFNRFVDNIVQWRAARIINEYTRGKGVYFLIIGNPYEDSEDLIEGIKFLEKLPPPFSLRPFNLIFLPGTKLFDRACRDGIINGVSDSGSFDSFLKINFMSFSWKRKNLYLNSLLSLMYGKCSRTRMGCIYRPFLYFLISLPVVNFFSRHDKISSAFSILFLSIADFSMHAQPISRQHKSGR